MRLIAFLNELSHPSDEASDELAKASVTNLIQLLRSIKKIRPGLELHSTLPLTSINIGRQRTFSSLKTNGDTREEWQFLRGLENRAFYLAGETRDLSTDYEHRGVQCVGLGLAHAFDALAVSFEGIPWRDSSLELLCRTLDADGNISESQEFVRHAATETNLQVIMDWLKTIPTKTFMNGEDLWNSRHEHFPSLRFLPRTEQQIVELKGGSSSLNPISLRLWQLERAATNWQPDSALPEFLSKVTPEHEQRKNLCQFESTASGTKSFDLHLRYTPGAGRIHIWCNSADRTIEIAHIGSKL